MHPIWLLIAFMALLSQVVCARQNNVNVAVRRHLESCDPEYFALSEKNLRESGSDEFYLNFILEKSREYPKEYEQLGEVSFFARHAFNGFDVRCDSQIEGCVGIPPCEYILDHVLRKGGDKVEARKIYFSIKKIEFIVEAVLWFNRLSVNIDHHAALVSEMLVRDFGSKGKKIIQDPCRMIKAGFAAVSTMAEALPALIASRPGGFSLGTIFTVSMKLVEQYGEDAKNHLDSKLLDKLAHGEIDIPKPRDGRDAFQTMCILEIGPQKADKYIVPFILMNINKLSHESDQVSEHKNAARGEGKHPDFVQQGAMLKKHIGKTSSSVRDTISKILDMIIAGNALDNPEFNYIYELMSRHDWADKDRQVFKSVDDKHATVFFEKSMVRFLWKDAKCYQKCVCSPAGTGDLCTFKDSYASTRYCSKDGNGCACQMQCASANSNKKDEVPLLGADQLPSWGLELSKILEESYEKYRRDQPTVEQIPSFEAIRDFEPVPDFDFGKTSIPLDIDKHVDLGKVNIVVQVDDVPQKLGQDLLTLPVCTSSQIRMDDFTGSRFHNKLFPCTCGDWRSSETKQFMEQLGLGVTQPGFKTDLATNLFTRECPSILARAKLKPFNHYLAFCELGIKFPHSHDVGKSLGSISRDDYYQARMGMIDSRCAKLKEETKDMSEDEANVYFCAISETRHEIFKDELHWITGSGISNSVLNIHSIHSGNHKQMCDKWMNYK